LSSNESEQKLLGLHILVKSLGYWPPVEKERRWRREEREEKEEEEEEEEEEERKTFLSFSPITVLPSPATARPKSQMHPLFISSPFGRVSVYHFRGKSG